MAAMFVQHSLDPVMRNEFSGTIRPKAVGPEDSGRRGGVSRAADFLGKILSSGKLQTSGNAAYDRTMTKAGQPLPALRSELSASALLRQVESDFRVFFPIRLYFVEIVARTLGAFQMVTSLGLLVADNNPSCESAPPHFFHGKRPCRPRYHFIAE